jgi:hypothetical protein
VPFSDLDGKCRQSVCPSLLNKFYIIGMTIVRHNPCMLCNFSIMNGISGIWQEISTKPLQRGLYLGLPYFYECAIHEHLSLTQEQCVENRNKLRLMT